MTTEAKAPSNSRRSTATTCTLTRRQVATILIDYMGWEPDDVSAFWRLAKREAQSPRCLAHALREQRQATLQALADL